MPKIVCVHSLSAEHVEQIKRVAPDYEVICGKDKAIWQEHLKDAEIMAGWNAAAKEEVFQPGSKLRWVQNWGAGVDRLPLEAFKEHGIALTTASGVHAYSISETIFAMMLSFSRKLHLSIRHQLNRKWQDVSPYGELHEKTIGIIGVGAIGEETARLAQAFRMKVLGVRRSGEPSQYVDRMYDNNRLDTVLAESDFVVVTLPLTSETRHLFGKREFGLMKPNAIFINIGRGGTTDTEALLEALRNGTIAGAGLDVFEQEPLPETSPLWSQDNVIITPHNSGSTDRYEERAMEIFLHNLKEYTAGSAPSLNRVDFSKQY